MLPIDQSKMAQVFDNVIQNAIETMTESGGTLWVSVTSSLKSLSGTDKVRVEFRDTGNGINSSMIIQSLTPSSRRSPPGLDLASDLPRVCPRPWRRNSGRKRGGRRHQRANHPSGPR